jgi:hypothetical protein
MDGETTFLEARFWVYSCFGVHFVAIPALRSLDDLQMEMERTFAVKAWRLP